MIACLDTSALLQCDGCQHFPARHRLDVLTGLSYSNLHHLPYQGPKIYKKLLPHHSCDACTVTHA